MPTINDPAGQYAGVTSEKRLLVHAVSVSAEHHANHHEGDMFSWIFSDDPDANDDCIFYIKNNDDQDLVLEGIDLYVSAACEVYLKLGGTGTINAAATDVTGAVLNAGSGEVADVTAAHDGDIESGGTFSGAVEVNRFKYGTAKDTSHINFVADLIIPKNQVFTIWCDTAAVVVEATIYGFFHDAEEAV